VVDALLEGGRSDVILDMLERTDSPSYGYQLAKGATALTEAWDANPLSSQDHFMLGHAEEWFYRGLGGINVDLSRKGAGRLVLRPAVPAKIEWVRTHNRSELGLVESSWKHAGDETAYSLVIPANATATIEVNTTSPQSVTVNGVPISKATGVSSSRVDGDWVQIVVGSGRFEVRAANQNESASLKLK
jgi:hypothetical protein